MGGFARLAASTKLVHEFDVCGQPRFVLSLANRERPCILFP
jgi:hypothetical protein